MSLSALSAMVLFETNIAVRQVTIVRPILFIIAFIGLLLFFGRKSRCMPMALQYHKMVILNFCNLIANQKPYLCDTKKEFFMNPVLTALMIPFLGTALGSAFVFFMKKALRCNSYPIR